MIVAIQQPEHLPWIGFFNKMAQCDLYVYLDNVQFKKRYFENRNKIKTRQGAMWLTVPVISKGHYSQKISEVRIDNTLSWVRSYKGSVEHTYKKAPFWNDVAELMMPPLESKFDLLVDLNLALISRICGYLGIDTPTVLASSLGVDQFNGSDIIEEICVKTKAMKYISGPDGRSYLNHNAFNKRGIGIEYHDFTHPEYPQLYGDFISHMSVLDIIANMGRESAQVIRNCYKIKQCVQ